MSSIVILGDSAATGVGDQVAENIYRGWGHYLFQCLVDIQEYHNISRPGARVNDLLYSQLPIALSIKPKIAIFIIGGNDVLRNNFNPSKMFLQLDKLIKTLQETGCEVYAMNLHDPTKILPIPAVLKKILKRRVLAVNEIYDALVIKSNLKLLDIPSKEEVYDLNFWHVDRMHPNRIGHQKLATYFANLLRKNGYKTKPIYVENLLPKSRFTNLVWMLKNGTPWFLKRSIDLLPVILFLTFCEFFKLTDRIAPKFEPSISRAEDFELIA